MNEVKCSVIVAVYRAEGLIHRCLDSLLAQTLKDFEVLLIDDGSPDNSGKICDDYARKDSRIRVFHQENKGVSSARQCGLDHARGEYVIHVDPDDWVDAPMLAELYAKAKAENADMVVCDLFLEMPKKTVYDVQRPAELSADFFLRQLLRQKLHGSCCNKLVRRSLFKEFKVAFPVEILCWEDLYVNCELLRHDIRLACVAKAFYHYDCHSNQGSIIHETSMRRLRSQILFCDYFSSELGEGYADDLIGSKRATKIFAYFTRKVRGKDYVNLYKETNASFFEHSWFYDVFHSDRVFIAIRMAIRGHYLLGSMVYKALKFVELGRQICGKD